MIAVGEYERNKKGVGDRIIKRKIENSFMIGNLNPLTLPPT